MHQPSGDRPRRPLSGGMTLVMMMLSCSILRMAALRGTGTAAFSGDIRRLRGRAEECRVVAEIMTSAEARAVFVGLPPIMTTSRTR